MAYRLRMLPGQYKALVENLSSNTEAEQGCFLLCSHAVGRTGQLLLVDQIILLSGADFKEQLPNLLSISPSAMLRVARQAQQGNKSVCMVHTHPMSHRDVAFSSADDLGNQRTFQFFSRMLPGKLNSALVFSGDMRAVSGRVYHAGASWDPVLAVEIIGNASFLNTTHQTLENPSGEEPEDIYHRQALLLGSSGQQILNHLKIGVIGLGGIGSLVTTYLAHSGVGKLVLVDPKKLKRSNRPRVICATPNDVSVRAKKIEIASRYIKMVRPDCDIEVFEMPVETNTLTSTLIELDALVCCTDNTQSRAYLNQICHQYYLPVLDLGVEFVACGNGQLVNETGKVNLMMPGSACFWCIGHVDSETLAAEALPKEEGRQRVGEGYIRNIYVNQPSMMMYNAEIAARGVQLLLGQIVGLVRFDEKTYERFSFLGLMRRQHHKLVRKRQSDECPFCASGGSYLGAGDAKEMLLEAVG